MSFDRTTPVANQPATSIFVRNKFNSLHDEAVKFCGEWSASQTYLPNSLVTEGGTLLFVSLQTTTGNQPSVSNAYWRQLTFPAEPANVPLSVLFVTSVETDSAEVTTLGGENVVTSITIPPNSFTKLLIETCVRLRATDGTKFTIRLKQGDTVLKVFESQATAANTRHELISTIINGGQVSNTTVTLTTQMELTSVAGTLSKYIRIWGIK